jgi:hypothetical protein
MLEEEVEEDDDKEKKKEEMKFTSIEDQSLDVTLHCSSVCCCGLNRLMCT